jgi:hypothetical protein
MSCSYNDGQQKLQSEIKEEWIRMHCLPDRFSSNIPKRQLKPNTPKSGNAVKDYMTFPGAGLKEKTIGLYVIRMALKKQTFLDLPFFGRSTRCPNVARWGLFTVNNPGAKALRGRTFKENTVKNAKRKKHGIDK